MNRHTQVGAGSACDTTATSGKGSELPFVGSIVSNFRCPHTGNGNWLSSNRRTSPSPRCSHGSIFIEVWKVRISEVRAAGSYIRSGTLCAHAVLPCKYMGNCLCALCPAHAADHFVLIFCPVEITAPRAANLSALQQFLLLMVLW